MLTIAENRFRSPLTTFHGGSQRTSPSLMAEMKSLSKEIIFNLRNNCRPSLAGKLPHVDARVEEIFRTEHITFLDYSSIDFEGLGFSGVKEKIQILSFMGNDSATRLSWEHFGLNEPTMEDKMGLMASYKKWEEMETSFPHGDLKAARSLFKTTFGDRFGIELKNVDTAGEIFFVMSLLQSIPKQTLSGSFLKTLNLRARGTSSSKYGVYAPEEREVRVIIPPFAPRYDRYKLLVIMLHELGHAVYASLSIDQMLLVGKIFTDFISRQAVFGINIWGASDENARITWQSFSAEEFFAENFMHFTVLGKTMLVNCPPEFKTLRGTLYSFYEGLYNGRYADILET